MPRGRKSDIFTAVRAQAARALKLLQNEIRERQADLAKMIAQADSWRALLGGGGSARRGSAGAAASGRRAGRRRGGKRVSWDEVLASVPQVFGIEHVLKHPGAASKGRAQIYPAFTRWEAAGRIKRVAKGRYEKNGAGAGRASATKAARKPRKAGGRRRRRAAAAKPRAKKAAEA